MNVVRSTSAIMAGRVGILGLGLVALTVFTRVLPSGELGTFFLFQSLLGVLTIPADLGIRHAITKRVSEDTERDRYFTAGLVLKTVLLAGVAVGVVAFRGPINAYLGSEVALALVAAVILQEYGLYFMASLRGELRVGETALWELLKTVGWTVVGGAVVVAGVFTGALGLIVGLLVGLSALVLVGVLRTSLRLRRPSVTHFRSIFVFGSYAALGSVGGLVYNWADVLILGLFVSRSHVAAYEVAWRVAMNVTIVSASIRTVVYPQASNWHANGETDRIERMLPDLLLVSLAVSIPAFVGGALLGSEILAFVFTPEYAFASVAFVVLLFNMIDSSVSEIAGGGLLYAFDRPDLNLRATATASVLNVVLNVALIPTFGLVGAAVATTVASMVGTVMNLAYIRSFVALEAEWSKLGWVCLVSAVMGGAILAVRTVFTISGLGGLLAVVLFGVVVYFCLLMTVGSFRTLATTVLGHVLSNTRQAQ